MSDTTSLVVGRELDALIAEKVMGRDDNKGVCAPRRGTLDDTYGRVLPDGYRERTPHYSTDIAAAWQVVEKMMRDGWAWKAYGATTGVTGIGFTKCPSGVPSVYYKGDALAHAICRAALAALSEENKG